MVSFCSSSREHRNTSTWLHRALVLEELSPTLRSTNFSCLFVDPGQVAQYHIILAQLWVRNLKKGIQEWEECYYLGKKGFSSTTCKLVTVVRSARGGSKELGTAVTGVARALP